MIKIENISTPSPTQWICAIRGCRNALNSWDKSDTHLDISGQAVTIGEKDRELMKKLTKAGTDHRKFLRMLPITVDITAPLYWIAELDTYKIGTVRNSCSFMHKGLSKEFELSDFDTKTNNCKETLEEIVAVLNILRNEYLETKDNKIFEQIRCLLPNGYLQRFTWFANYEVLLKVYYARKNHRLSEWHDFCDWIKGLPLMNDLIGE